MFQNTFDDAEATVLGAAFDRAWDNAVHERILDVLSIDEAKDIIAKRIMAHAQRGERDEWRLARGALLFVRTFTFEESERRKSVRYRRSSSGS